MKTKYFIGSALILFSLVIFGLRISKGVVFKQNVKGYLKRAADANTIDLAAEELAKAVDYLEANDLTSGYTSIFWKEPAYDISFWYKNLKVSLQELRNLDVNTTSSLEKTNVLIKLRETLLDQGEKVKVTVPRGISVYPDNKQWAFLMFVAFAALFSSLFFFADPDKIYLEVPPNNQASTTT